MTRFLPMMTALALLVPMSVGAQYRREGPPRGPEHLSRVIADCEQRTDVFKVSLRRALERSGYRDSSREHELNIAASRLERAMNRVREAWNRERNPPKTRAFVSEAITAGQDINRTMTRHRLDPGVQQQWSAVRTELNRMAEAFELPRVSWR
jgi:hypothetical protein